MKKENAFTMEWRSNLNYSFEFFDENSLTDTINMKTFPQPFFQIVGLFAEDSNFHLHKCHAQPGSLFVRGTIRGTIRGTYEDKECELMLRYGGEKAQLVVARVTFIHKREGKMTELYRILKRIKRYYHTGSIVIESVGSEEMESWCVKNSFIKDSINSRSYIEG